MSGSVLRLSFIVWIFMLGVPKECGGTHSQLRPTTLRLYGGSAFFSPFKRSPASPTKRAPEVKALTRSTLVYTSHLDPYHVRRGAVANKSDSHIHPTSHINQDPGQAGFVCTNQRGQEQDGQRGEREDNDVAKG